MLTRTTLISHQLRLLPTQRPRSARVKNTLSLFLTLRKVSTPEHDETCIQFSPTPTHTIARTGEQHVNVFNKNSKKSCTAMLATSFKLTYGEGHVELNDKSSHMKW
eukprot:PhM_4_TR18642/c3_g1_i16/m.23276